MIFNRIRQPFAFVVVGALVVLNACSGGSGGALPTQSAASSAAIAAAPATKPASITQWKPGTMDSAAVRSDPFHEFAGSIVDCLAGDCDPGTITIYYHRSGFDIWGTWVVRIHSGRFPGTFTGTINDDQHFTASFTSPDLPCPLSVSGHANASSLNATYFFTCNHGDTGTIKATKSP